MVIIKGISHETTNELTEYAMLCRNVTFTDKNYFFYFKCGETGKRAGIQTKTFQVAVSLNVLAM